MKNTLLFCFISVSLLSFSQKNNDKVRLINVDGIDYFYKYDEKGRISQVKQSDKSFFEKYTYLGDSAIVKQYIDLIDSSLAGITLLNKTGLAEVGTKIFPNDIMTIKNEYDENNQKTLQIVSLNNTKSTIVYTNKNQNTIMQTKNDTIFSYGKFRIQNEIIKSTFSNELSHLQYNTTEFYDGYENKNLLISETLEVFSSDFCDQFPCPFISERTQFLEYKYDYIFDKIGRIKTRTTTNLNTNKKSIKQYYYY